MRIILSLLLIQMSFTVDAANFYWVNGSGLWSDFANHWSTTSGGNVFRANPPTQADNVFFDTNSFTGPSDSVDLEISGGDCLSLDFTGANNPVITGNGALNIYGSFIIHANVDWNLNANINFNSNASGNIIDVLGADFRNYLNYYPQINFNGTGTWDFQSDIDMYDTALYSGEIYVWSGIVNTNNHHMRYTRFTCVNGLFNLGTSLVECWTWNATHGIDADSAIIKADRYLRGGWNQYYNIVETKDVSGDTCTFNSVISEIARGNQNQFINLILQANQTEISGDGNHFTKVTVTASPNLLIAGNHTYDTLLINPGAIVTLNDMQTITNLFQADGNCSNLTELNGSYQAVIQKAGGNVVLNNAIIRNVSFTGASFTANNSFRQGNVSGITINNPVTRNLYWVGNGGNWNDVAHWSNSSGGPSGVCIPSLNDNVFIDVNSFSSAGDTIKFIRPINYCKNLNFTGANNPCIGGQSDLVIAGSFLAPTAVRSKLYGFFRFETTTTGNIIDASGFRVDSAAFHNFEFQGGGSWELQSDFIIDTMIQCCSIVSLDSGILYTRGHTIKCREFRLSGGEIHLSTSIVNVNYFGHVYNNYPCIVFGDTSTINALYFSGGTGNGYFNVNADRIDGDSCIFNDVLGNELHTTNSSYHNALLGGSWNRINGAGNTFNKLSIATPGLECNYANTFDSLVINVGGEVVLDDTISVNSYLSVNGTCSGPIIIRGATQAFVYKNGGSVILNYVHLNLLHFFGATFTANNSFDLGLATGITINNAPQQNLYWVGGGGSWSDSTHWSATSGGPGGYCLPTPNSDVFFDSNSFTSPFDTVKAYSSLINCRSINTTGANQPVFFFYYALNIYGSIIMPSPVTLNFPGTEIYFRSTTPEIINAAGARFDTTYYPTFNFYGGSTIDLQSDLRLDTIGTNNGGYIFENGSGSFRTNGYKLFCRELRTNSGSIYLDTSTVVVDSWNRQNIFYADADSAKFITTGQFQGKNHDAYRDVKAVLIDCDSCTFNDVEVSMLTISHTTIHNALFPTGGTISGIGNVFNKLNAGGYSMDLGGTQDFDSIVLNVDPSVASFNTGMIVSVNDTQNVYSYFQADGLCSRLVELKNGTLNYLVGGNINFNYMKLANMKFIGATFTATNSLSSGIVTGITVNSTSARNLYWVNGSGELQDSLHWSGTSGGPGGECPPTATDTLYFDANSFSAPGDTLRYWNYFNEFGTMNFTGANKPVLTNLGTNPFLKINGSLIVPDTLQVVALDFINMNSTAPGNVLNLAGLQCVGSRSPFIQFDGIGGKWDLQSDIRLDLSLLGGTIEVTNGELNCNDRYIQCTGFTSSPGGTASFHNSSILCSYWSTISGHIVADSTDITSLSYFTAGTHNSYFDVTVAERLDGDSSTFRDVRVSDLYAGNSFFRNVVLLDTAVSLVGANNSFVKLTVASSTFNLYSNEVFDTLILNQPGMNVTLFGRQDINSYFYIASDPLNPVSLSGQDTLNYPDTLCVDFLSIQNINTVGGPFYAGVHSTDLGGNSGWLFSSCVPQYSNVWPGDANYDLTVDNNDLLYIGIAFSDTGFIRPSATINWIAQPCLDWYYTFSNGINEKRADSDGDGIISYSDTNAVLINYGMTHPFRIANPPIIQNSVGADFFLVVPPGNIPPGTQISVPIVLGTTTNPANNLYGIAFTINYDPAMVVAGSVTIDFSNSWIDNGNNHLNILKDFSSSGKCEVAFTRIDNINVSGNGIIGVLNFTVPNTSGGFLNLNLSKTNALSNSLVEIPIVENSDSTLINGIKENYDQSIIVYPNPSKDFVIIKLENIGKSRIRLINLNGQVIREVDTDKQQIEINHQTLEKGMYFLNMTTRDKVIVRKVIFE